ncbi:MAG: hypothetical protein QM790_16420 [Nibricoccus sp.]
MMLPKIKIKSLTAVVGLCLVGSGCITAERESVDADYNYPLVFFGMREPKPVIVHSRLERYAKDMGLWTSKEHNGEWEFEILAPKAWVEEAKTGFVSTSFNDSMRKPKVAWWKPNAEDFDAYQMPYSSYPAAHLYVEKHPKDESRIHVFVQRH